MFEKHTLNQLYRFCYSLTVNESNAYDLLQNALEKFLKSGADKHNNLAFMYKIIRHQFIDDYRKQNKYTVVDFDEQEYLDFDVKTLEAITIEDDLIEQVLDYLDAQEREILYYWAVEGYSTQQISDMLEMPKGTILSKIHRMRIRIKQQFSEEVHFQPK